MTLELMVRASSGAAAELGDDYGGLTVAVGTAMHLPDALSIQRKSGGADERYLIIFDAPAEATELWLMAVRPHRPDPTVQPMPQF